MAQRGWHLILDARGGADLERIAAELATWTKVTAIAGDITDAAHRSQLLQAARQSGHVDLVVNNASILGPSPQPRVLDYPTAILEQVFQVNTFAPVWLLQDLQPVLAEHVRILNITSDAAIEGYEEWGGYGASKAALEQLTNVLAAEEPGWRVYRVDPGDMRTQMHQEAFPGEDISDRPLPAESLPGLIELIEGDLPSGRYQARSLVCSLPQRVGAVTPLAVAS